MRASVLAAVLAVLCGCAVPSTVPRDLARAREAYTAGQMWKANRLLRAAAHGGSLDAQMELASQFAPTGGPSGGGSVISEREAWFSPFPGPRERAVWARTARTTAARLAAAGDPKGYLELGVLAHAGNLMSSRKPSPDSVVQARRHYETAIALGSAKARQHLAFLVWSTDGLLAAEPYFQASLAAGNVDAAGMLSHIALQRPLLARGLHPRDVAPGDLSMLDIAGSIRVLRDAGDAKSLDDLNTRVGALREQAQAGNAEADSLLSVLGTAGLLG